MLKVAILDDYQQVALRAADWSVIRPQCEIETYSQPFTDAGAAAAALADTDVVCLMRERMTFPRELIECLPRLKLICTTGINNKSIDISAASSRGILVSHTRSGDSEHPTAELTWALILASLRHLPTEDRRLRSGHWQATIGRTLHGKTLGLVGLGRLGSKVASIGKAFGMAVQAWSPRLTSERCALEGVAHVAKDVLFATSDVISLHLVLSETTRQIVGSPEFRLMARDAIIINTSRGPLIDEGALLDALTSGQIAGAGLDVFDVEPLPKDHPFKSMENVVLTPHLGYVTEETYQVFFSDIIEDIAAFLAGKPIRLLNPQVGTRR